MFTHEELMELRRALTVYIDWCETEIAIDGPNPVFIAKVQGARKMQDDIDDELYPED